jgi:hypothetical protein
MLCDPGCSQMAGMGETRVCVMKAAVDGRRRGCKVQGADVQDDVWEPHNMKASSAPPVIALRGPSRR